MLISTGIKQYFESLVSRLRTINCQEVHRNLIAINEIVKLGGSIIVPLTFENISSNDSIDILLYCFGYDDEIKINNEAFDSREEIRSIRRKRTK